MKYKYIGTEEQLIEHGFVLVYTNVMLYERKGAKEIFVHFKSDLYVNRIIRPNSYDYLVVQEDIQDLIDANLVEVIK